MFHEDLGVEGIRNWESTHRSLDRGPMRGKIEKQQGITECGSTVWESRGRDKLEEWGELGSYWRKRLNRIPVLSEILWQAISRRVTDVIYVFKCILLYKVLLCGVWKQSNNWGGSLELAQIKDDSQRLGRRYSFKWFSKDWTGAGLVLEGFPGRRKVRTQFKCSIWKLSTWNILIKLYDSLP